MLFRNLGIIVLIGAAGSLYGADQKNYVVYKVVDQANSEHTVSQHVASMINVDDSTTLKDFVKHVTSRYTGYNLWVSIIDEDGNRKIVARKTNGQLNYDQEMQKITPLKSMNGVTVNGSLNDDDYRYLPGYKPKATTPLMVSVISKEQ